VKVLINAASANMGGALTYISNLIGELCALANGDRFIVVVPSATSGHLEKVVDRRVVTLLAYPHQSGGIWRRLAFDNWTVPHLAREHQADVLFSSTGFATLRAPCPQLLLVRNHIYFCPVYQEKHRELGRSCQSIRTRRWMSVLSIRAADIAMFPTDAMRQLVATRMSLARKHTEVLHYGFARDRFFQNGVEEPPIVRRIDQWRREGYRILLHVSACAIHKNLETVIDALPLLSSSGMKVKLVTTLTRGSRGDPDVFDRLMMQTRRLGLSDTVTSSGHLEHRQLHHLYRKADVFVFPSFTESFGHPLVEAMACGLPVVASDMAINRELCGDAACYFDTFSPQSCANALCNTLQDRDRRTAMQRRSFERAKQFSWRSYSIRLRDIWRKMLS